MARILYIEDNEKNLYLIAFILENAGHQVIPARNGPQGLALAESARPDLTLLDFQLPGMDGKEVLAKLKSSPFHSGDTRAGGRLLCHGRRPGELSGC